MNKKNIIILASSIAFFIIALIFFIVLKTNNVKENKTGSITITDKNKPSGFVFYDEYDSKMKISDFVGTPIAIIFWNSKSASIDALKLINEIYDDYKQDITFLIINTSESNEDITELVNDYGFKFSVYYDKDNLAKKYYSYIKLPSIIFLNANGEKSTQIESKVTKNLLTTNLDKIIE